MPTFNFSIVNNNHKEKQIKKVNISKKDITGIICINIKGEFFVNIGTELIPILTKCYSSYGKEKIFSRYFKDNKKLCIIREIDKCIETDINHYLPFCPGCIVIGNVINDFIKGVKFDIKSIKLEYENEESKKAYLYWKDNYKQIEENRNNNGSI